MLNIPEDTLCNATTAFLRSVSMVWCVLRVRLMKLFYSYVSMLFHELAISDRRTSVTVLLPMIVQILRSCSGLLVSRLSFL